MKYLQLVELIQQHHPHMGWTEITAALNQASDDFAAKTELIKTSYAQNSVAGQRYYELHSDIIRIVKVQINDVDIPRLIGSPGIDDDEWGGEEGTAAPSTSSNERYWYVDNNRLGIVEKVTNAITRDDKTSNYQSISVAKEIRIHAISQATALLGTQTEQVPEFPSQFHDALSNRVIAEGYLRPPNLNPNVHTVFDVKYKEAVKAAKAFSRSNYNTSGTIKQVHF
jgi:hypothetical protein